MSIINLDTRILLFKQFKSGGVGAEIGVCRGANAMHLYMCAKPRLLHLVDVWECDTYTKTNHKSDLFYDDWENNVKEIFSDHINQDVFLHKETGISFLSKIEDNYLDWVYLDSDHLYDNIYKEIELSIKKVKKGGFISGHDFCFNNYWKSGVFRAVLEHIQNGNIIMRYITDEQFASYCCEVIK